MNMQRCIAIGFVLPFFMISLMWAANAASAAGNGPLKEPAMSVLENYEQIQKALAADSMTGVSQCAGAMARAIRVDQGKTISLRVATEAEKLAEAQDLRAARRAFKPLSASLIGWMADSKLDSTGYKEAYCPMADASWLQKGDEIVNPYYGKKMLHCGAIERSF